jgi:hypothetical protein
LPGTAAAVITAVGITAVGITAVGITAAVIMAVGITAAVITAAVIMGITMAAVTTAIITATITAMADVTGTAGGTLGVARVGFGPLVVGSGLAIEPAATIEEVITFIA